MISPIKGNIRQIAGYLCILMIAVSMGGCLIERHSEKKPDYITIETVGTAVRRTGTVTTAAKTASSADTAPSRNTQANTALTSSPVTSKASQTASAVTEAMITAARATTAGTTAKAATTTARTATVTTAGSKASVNGQYIVGYYANWASYSGITPDKLQVSKLTHLNYAFAAIDANGKLAMSDSVNDLKNFSILKSLKAANKGLKTLISVGGWDDSQKFSDAALTSYSRAVFAQSCVDFVVKYGFDGVDIDWEYPVSGGKSVGRTEDRQNFTYLLQTIRQKLNERGAKDGKKYTLTIAGAAGSSYLQKIEVGKVASAVDFIFIMAYDLHGPWDGYADLNAALYDPAGTSPQYKLSADDAVTVYLNAGVPSSKLVLGMPFYGYRYSVTGSANNGLFGSFTSAKSISYDSIISSYLNNTAFRLFYHPTAMVPYLFGNNTFISFDNAQSIAEKVGYAKSRRLAGVGAWELSQDKHGVLLSSAYSVLNG